MPSIDSFPVGTAQLTSNYFETLTYGIYLVSCGFCARALLFTQSRLEGQERLRRLNEMPWLMLSVFSTLFIVNTFDDIAGLVHNIAGFVELPNAEGATRKQAIANTDYWINIARTGGQVINIILVDSVLIYRCYVVYARRWLVIVPSLILQLAGIAIAAQLIHVQIVSNNDQIMMKPWWTAFFAIPLAQNLLTTPLLVWRIWRVERQNKRFLSASSSTSYSQHPLRKAIRIIAESGAAYAMTLFMTFMMSLCDPDLLFIAADATLQAAGIAFNLIIIRSSLRSDEQFNISTDNDRTENQPHRSSRVFSTLAPNTLLSQISMIDDSDVNLELATMSTKNQPVVTALPVEGSINGGLK